MLLDHQEHVRRYADVRGSQPLRHASAQHAAACSTPPWSTRELRWHGSGGIALIAAMVVVLAACSIALIAVGDPLLSPISAALLGFLVVWFGSPLMKAWLWGASFIRPSFSLAH